jgi:hypothetical protein
MYIATQANEREIMDTLDIDTLDNGTTLIITDENDRNFKFRKADNHWWLIFTEVGNPADGMGRVSRLALRRAITEASFITIKEAN